MSNHIESICEKHKYNPSFWTQHIIREVTDQIWEHLSRQHISPAQLAIQMGKSEKYVWKVLDGEKNFSIRRLAKICMALRLVPEFKLEEW